MFIYVDLQWHYFSSCLQSVTSKLILFKTTKIVSGVVISASDNQPLWCVSVIVKGTSIGTMTDIDGKYSLNVKSGSHSCYLLI